MGIEVGTGLALGAGANLLGGLMGANAAGKAADTQAAAADRANALQRYIYDQTRADQEPFRQTGLQANATLRELLPSLLESNPTLDPGYQFGLAEGEKGVQRAMRRVSGADSGQTLKALLRYNQDYAGTKYNEAFNRDLAGRTTKYNFLAGLTGAGQAATQAVGSAGQSYANNAGQAMMSGANARAAGLVGQSNAIAGGLNNAANQYMNYQFMNRAFPTKPTIPTNAPI